MRKINYFLFDCVTYLNFVIPESLSRLSRGTSYFIQSHEHDLVNDFIMISLHFSCVISEALMCRRRILVVGFRQRDLYRALVHHETERKDEFRASQGSRVGIFWLIEVFEGG